MSTVITGCSSSPKPSVSFVGINQVTIPYRDTSGVFRFEEHPHIMASINGVTGMFIIDTGATVPILTKMGARKCGIEVSSNRGTKLETWDGRGHAEVISNVTVRLTPQVAVTWKRAVLHPGDAEFFGIIDYASLKAARALIDMERKTITLRR